VLLHIPGGLGEEPQVPEYLLFMLDARAPVLRHVLAFPHRARHPVLRTPH
jgi:hypothetical protein